MNTKVYRTYDEINKDLEILKVEKELAYLRFTRDLEQTKDSLEPMNLIGEKPRQVIGLLGAFSGPLKSAFLTWLFKKIF